MGRLNGKRCLVTAAGAGIGRATAIAMAAEGARVLATDVNADLLADLPKTDGLAAERLDVLDRDAVLALAARLRDVNVIANCAGFVEHGTILDTDEKAWAFSFDLNVTAMYRIIRAFLPAMLAQGGGSIVNIASVASSVVGVPNRCAYGASKAAVIGLTKSVAADFVTQGIRCNCICPGTVDSPSLHEPDARPGRLRRGARRLRRPPAHGAARHRRRRSRRSPSTSPRTRAPSPPASRTSPTAAGPTSDPGGDDMKLLRYGPQGPEKPGLLDEDGKIRDLAGLVGDISGATLSDEGLERLRKLDTSKLPEVDPSVRLGPCVAGTGKFVCIGLNYSDHAAETGASRCRPSRSSS